MRPEFKCVLCGRHCTGWGNNPWPISTEGQCCDECNLRVIEARIARRTEEMRWRPSRRDN